MSAFSTSSHRLATPFPQFSVGNRRRTAFFAFFSLSGLLFPRRLLYYFLVPSRNTIHPARWCNGSTSDSGSFSLGSSPGRAATFQSTRFGVFFYVPIPASRTFFPLFSGNDLIFARPRRKVYDRRFPTPQTANGAAPGIRTPEAAGFYPPFFPAVSLFLTSPPILCPRNRRP